MVSLRQFRLPFALSALLLFFAFGHLQQSQAQSTALLTAWRMNYEVGASGDVTFHFSHLHRKTDVIALVLHNWIPGPRTRYVEVKNGQPTSFVWRDLPENTDLKVTGTPLTKPSTSNCRGNVCGRRMVGRSKVVRFTIPG